MSERGGYIQVLTYEAASKSFERLGDILVGEDAYGDAGVAVALSGDGKTLAYGARTSQCPNDCETLKNGKAAVYSYNTANGWTQMGADLIGEFAGDRFGTSVALSTDGTILAVGAVWNDASSIGGNAGHVRIFRFVGGEWGQLGEDIDGVASGDGSGNAISLSGDGLTVAVAARNNDGNGNGSGQVRVFGFSDGSGWTQIGGEIFGEPSAGLGSSVSLSTDGTVLAIGASQGRYASVYKLSVVRQWVRVANAVTDRDSMGEAVSLSANGRVLAVGAPDINNVGQVRIYRLAQGDSKWEQVGVSIDGEGPFDDFGSAVSLSADGDVVAIGARDNESTDDDDTRNTGRVRVLTIDPACLVDSPPTQVPSPSPTTASPTLSPVAAPPSASPTRQPTARPTASPARPTTQQPVETLAPTPNPTPSGDELITRFEGMELMFTGVSKLTREEMTRFETTTESFYARYFVDGKHGVWKVSTRVSVQRQKYVPPTTTAPGTNTIVYDQDLSYHVTTNDTLSAEHYLLLPFTEPDGEETYANMLRDNIPAFRLMQPPLPQPQNNVPAAVPSSEDDEQPVALLAGVGVAAFVLLMVLGVVLARYWENSRIPQAHVLVVTTPDSVAPSTSGNTYQPAYKDQLCSVQIPNGDNYAGMADKP